MNPSEEVFRNFCKQRFPLPTERQVTALEERIGIDLPGEFRRYLLDFNGGLFNEPRIVPPSDDCPLDRLTFLHGIGAPHSVAELCSEADLALFDDNDPPEVIVIGATMMGGLILMITHYEDNGCILLKKAFGGSFFLADDIEDFLLLLRKAED